MIIVGIDPGLTGAVAFIGQNSAKVADLPTRQISTTGKVQRRIDGAQLGKLLRENIPPDEWACVFIEQVGAFPPSMNNAVQTQVSLGRTLGACEGVVECQGLELRHVNIREWKGHYGIKADKDRALEVARALFPELAADLKRKLDHNRAEALLIAKYGMGLQF